MRLLEHRLIAMLDILGFSSRLLNAEAIQTAASSMAEVIAQVKSEVLVSRSSGDDRSHDVGNLAAAHFVFDNVVLVSHELSGHTVSRFVAAVTELMRRFACLDLPLRGAISLGSYCCDENSGLFLSDRFKSLTTAESLQDWAGCVVLPEASSAICSAVNDPTSGSVTRSSCIVSYVVPRKAPTSDKLDLCLNWIGGLGSDETDKVLKFLGGDPAKVECTRRFAEYVAALPDASLPLPAEFLPAIRVRVNEHRSGLGQYLFLDERGQPCVLGTVHFVHDPKIADPTRAFIGYSTEAELNDRRRARGWNT